MLKIKEVFAHKEKTAQKEQPSKSYIIEGTNIGFRALTEDDVEGNWYNWFNDPEVTKYLSHGAFPNTRENQKAFYQKNVVDSDNQVIFAIEDKAAKKHIGVASIRNINWVNRGGEMAIIIGERDFRIGSNALEAYYLTVKHAFLNMNLHRLFTATLSENEVSLEYCKRIGFSDIGIARDVCYKGGVYKDCVYADLLRDEWLEKEELK